MPGPLESPGFWLHQAALVWAADLAERLRPLGLSPAQFYALAATNLLSRRGAVNQQAIADFSGADRQMTSRLLRVLEGKGLVERTASGRTVLVKTTPAGHDLTLRAVPSTAASDRHLFGASGAELLPALRAIGELRSRNSIET